MADKKVPPKPKKVSEEKADSLLGEDVNDQTPHKYFPSKQWKINASIAAVIAMAVLVLMGVAGYLKPPSDVLTANAATDIPVAEEVGDLPFIAKVIIAAAEADNLRLENAMATYEAEPSSPIEANSKAEVVYMDALEGIPSDELSCSYLIGKWTDEVARDAVKYGCDVVPLAYFGKNVFYYNVVSQKMTDLTHMYP